MNVPLELYRSTVKTSKDNRAFTLLELIVVIAGLGILAGLAIPNFLKYLEFAQIDEAKSLLNAAAAECLQRYRTHPTDWTGYQPEVLKTRSLPGNYVYKGNLKTCNEIEIYDPASANSTTLLPMFKFTLAGGKLIKESQFTNPESERDCKSWGNCGGSPSAQYLKTCFATKGTCDTNLSTALAASRDTALNVKAWLGSCTWPADTNCGCKRDVWACSNKAYFSQPEFNICLTAKASAACNARRATLASQTPAFDGPDTSGICPTIDYWCAGRMFADETSYLSCGIEQTTIACNAELSRRKTSPYVNGLFDKLSNGKGCTATYTCNGGDGSKDWYEKDSACKTPIDDKKKICRRPNPDPWYCPWRDTWPECQPICTTS